MRRLILTAAVALALAGCGKKNQTDNANVVGDNLTAEAIVSNDVTAIDAVTGDAANMAADVDMNYGDLSNVSGDEQPAEPAKPAPHQKSAPSAASASDNSSAASPANTTTNAD